MDCELSMIRWVEMEQQMNRCCIRKNDVCLVVLYCYSILLSFQNLASCVHLWLMHEMVLMEKICHLQRKEEYCMSIAEHWNINLIIITLNYYECLINWIIYHFYNLYFYIQYIKILYYRYCWQHSLSNHPISIQG